MQNPGRGNSPKTGAGIPTPFRQEIELTRKYSTDKAKQQAQVKKGNTPSGLKVDPSTGTASAKDYEKTFEEPSAANAFKARIKDSKGNVVSEAKAESVSGNYIPGGGKAVEALKKQYEKNKSYTNQDRKRNESQFNATSGGTTPDKLTADQKKTLIKLGKAVKV